MIPILTIEARHIGMDAKTKLVVVKVLRGEAKIIRFNRSKTGNHWQETLFATPDFTGWVAEVDVSNSGKHRCKLYTIFAATISYVRKPSDDPNEYWREPCPVCKLVKQMRREL